MTTEVDTRPAATYVPTGKNIGLVIRRMGVVIAFFFVCLIFGILSPTFTTPTNLLNILDQSVVLALVAMAMTTVIVAGGIDLSVAISFDFGAMAAITLLELDMHWGLAILGGLLLGLVVGLFNALMIVKVGISPFLATLGMLFIGESVQRIYTRGGEPIYMATMPEGYRFLGRGKLFNIVPFDLILTAVIVIIFYLLIEQTIHGKRWRALGSQYEAARVAGLRVQNYSALSYIVSALVCATAGILLSSSLSSYVPISGSAYLLDAIGATFIGTSIDPESRPNVPGTVLGVIFLGVVANGLNLVGINFYWQTVARGVLVFIALALGALNQRRSR